MFPNIASAIERINSIRATLPSGNIDVPSPINIQRTPSFQELHMLTCQPIWYGLTIRAASTREINLHVGHKDSIDIMGIMRDEITVLAKNNSTRDPAIIFEYALQDPICWGALERYFFLTQQFAAQVTNFHYEDGRTNLDGDALNLSVDMRRCPTAQPFQFPLGARLSWQGNARYIQMISSALFKDKALESFSVHGLPRVASERALCQLDVLTWTDFNIILRDFYKGDSFAAFMDCTGWQRFITHGLA